MRPARWLASRAKRDLRRCADAARGGTAGPPGLPGDHDSRKIGGRRAGSDDRVPPPARLLPGEVGAVVAAAALLTTQGRLGDQPSDEQEVSGLEAGARDG